MSTQSEKRHRRKERKRLVRCLRHSNIDTKQVVQKYEITNRKEINKINQITDMLESIKNNPQLTAEKCEKFKITVNNDTIDELIKNSNLRFTKISDCKNEYEVYFSIIDQDSEGKTKEYDALFIEE